MLPVEICVVNSFIFSVSTLTILQSWFLSDGNLVFFSDIMYYYHYRDRINSWVQVTMALNWVKTNNKSVSFLHGLFSGNSWKHGCMQCVNESKEIDLSPIQQWSHKNRRTDKCILFCFNSLLFYLFLRVCTCDHHGQLVDTALNVTFQEWKITGRSNVNKK